MHLGFLKKLVRLCTNNRFFKTEGDLIVEAILSSKNSETLNRGDPIIFDNKDIGIFLKNITAKEMLENVDIEVGFMGGIEFNLYETKDNSKLSYAVTFALDLYLDPLGDKKKTPTFHQILIGNKKIITVPIEVQKLS